MPIDKNTLCVGAEYHKVGSGEVRKILGIGSEYAAQGQADTDCLRYTVTAGYRRGLVNNMTRKKFAYWADYPVDCNGNPIPVDKPAEASVKAPKKSKKNTKAKKKKSTAVIKEGITDNTWADVSCMGTDVLENLDIGIHAISGNLIQSGGNIGHVFSPTLWDWLHKVCGNYINKPVTIIIKEASDKELVVNAKPEMVFAMGRYMEKTKYQNRMKEGLN